MKKVILVVLLSVFGMAESTQATNGKSLEVCKAYINQAKAYKETMGTDKISQDTFAFYKEKMLIHCGNIVSKEKFERKSFVEMMAKSEKNTTKECRAAIDMASNYSKNANQSEIIIAAHKENIVDHCGTLVASHVSSYCLYDEAK